ncbi:MAG: hypothetical protein ACR2KK_14355 [Acidimicrobiales bacterium]
MLTVAASAAFACTNLATINLSSPMGKPGEAITVTGTGFMASAAEMPMDDGMVMDMAPGGTGMAPTSVRSPVVLRWNGPDGPVLSEAIPDRGGTISVLFTIPETQAGYYTVLAVQKNLHGFDVYGTPARAPVQVIGPGGPKANDARGSGAAGVGGPSNSPGFLALTAGLGVLGVALLAAGAVAATRTVRVRRGVAVKVDGRSD